MLGSAVFAGLIVFHLDKNKVGAILAGGLAFSHPFFFASLLNGECTPC